MRVLMLSPLTTFCSVFVFVLGSRFVVMVIFCALPIFDNVTLLCPYRIRTSYDYTPWNIQHTDPARLVFEPTSAGRFYMMGTKLK